MDNLDLKIDCPRTRIAPSPTGPFHIGTARAALFNYLFSKKYGGKFILRIEDTDQQRSEKKWEQNIVDGLKWLGIVWDEGPNPENIDGEYLGSFGPYRQSERGNIYKKYIEKLLKDGLAYYCFCSEEELKAKRNYYMSIGQAPKYDGKCKDLSQKEVQNYLNQKKPSVIRFKVSNKKIIFNDLIHGKIETESSLMGDIVIAKNIYLPLYNLAAVIDDYEMKITHVIRGEDHISNTPKQILLYEAFKINPPQFAHIPLILGPDKSKLSKRHGAVSVEEYKKRGYLPESMINFMALLGWNPDSEREIFSMASLIKEFSLEKCQKSSAVFNEKKLLWINGFYIRQKNIKKLTELCLPYLIEANFIERTAEEKKYPPVFGEKTEPAGQKFIIKKTGEIISLDYVEKIVSLYQDRLEVLSQIKDLTDFFFEKNVVFEKDLLKWKDADDKKIIEALSIAENLLSAIGAEEWKLEKIKEVLTLSAQNFGKGDRGYLLWPLRVALTGKKASAGPFEIAAVLGKEKTIFRIKEAKKLISKKK